MFELVSKYKPSGDQPQAIEKLAEGIKNGGNYGEKIEIMKYIYVHTKKLLIYLSFQIVIL